MGRYKELSDHIQGIFHRFTPLVEPISLDEAFLEVTASIKLFGPAEEIAVRIKQLVYGETGLTASAGVASSKLVDLQISGDRAQGRRVAVVGGKEIKGPVHFRRIGDRCRPRQAWTAPCVA